MKTPANVNAMERMKWQNGYCDVFAVALQDFLGRGELVCLWVDGGYVHLYLGVDGLAYDSENKGICEKELHNYWRSKINPRGCVELAREAKLEDFAKYGAITGNTAANGFPAPPPTQYQEAKSLIENDTFFIALKQKWT